MAFPASQQALADGLITIQRVALRHKQFMTQARNQLSTVTVSANQVIQVLTETKSVIEIMERAAAVSGMAQFAKNQFDDQGLDIVAEFQSLRSGLEGVRDWVIGNFPMSPGGFIEKDTLETDGSITVRQFTPAQTAGLVSVLDTSIATIG